MRRNAGDAAQGDDGGSHLGAVGSHISNQGSFDSRNYGYRKLSDLIEATGLVEVRKNGQLLSVRAKQAAAPRKQDRHNAAGRGMQDAGSQRRTCACIATVLLRRGIAKENQPSP